MKKISLTLLLAAGLFIGANGPLWAAAEKFPLDNIIDPHGSTMLMYAAQANNLEAAQQLITAQCNVNQADYNGFTPLMYATFTGSHDMVELLLIHNANPDWQSNDENTALRIAAENGHSHIVKILLKFISPQLLDMPGKEQTTLLIAAIKHGHTNVVDTLIKANANLTTIDTTTQKTPLQLAQHLNFYPIALLLQNALALSNPPPQLPPKLTKPDALYIAVTKNNISQINKLIKEHADVNKHYFDSRAPGITALMVTTSPEIAEALIAADADVNALTQDHSTALMYAASTGQHLIVRILLKHNANINAVNDQGHTAWQLAATEGHINVIEEFLHADMNINNQNNATRNSMLMTAAEHGHEKLAQHLLTNSINPDLTDSNGRTALAITLLHEHNNVAILLLQHNASVHIVDHRGQTAFLLASQFDNLEIAQQLVKQKADIHQPILNSQLTPILIASVSGYEPMAQFLLKHDIPARDKLIAYQAAHNHEHYKIAQLIDPQRYQQDQADFISRTISQHQSAASNASALTQCANHPDCIEKKHAALKCGRCKITPYCSEKCQRAHWKIHKTTCKAPEAEPKKESGASAAATALPSESQNQTPSPKQPDQDTKEEPTQPLTKTERNKQRLAERAAKLKQHEADEAARLAKIHAEASQRLATAIQEKDTRGVLDRMRQKIALLPEDEKELTPEEHAWYLELKAQNTQAAPRSSSSSNPQTTPQGPPHAHYGATSHSHASAAAGGHSHPQSADKKPKMKPQKKPKTKQPKAGTSHHHPQAAPTPSALPTLARGSRQPAPEPLPTPDNLSAELIAILNKKIEERELQREQERREATLVQQAADTPALEPEVTPENDVRAIPYSPELKAQALPERYVTVIEHPRLGILKADLNHIVFGDRDGGLHLDYQNEQETSGRLTRLQVNTFAHENNGCYSAKYTIPGTNQTRDSSLFPSTWKSKTLIEKFRQAIQDPLCHIYEEQSRNSNAQPAHPDTCVIGRMFDIQNINNNPDNQQMCTIYFKAIIKKKSARDGIAILRTIYPITQEDYQQIATPHPEHKQQEQIELLQALRESLAIAGSDELNRAVATSVSEFNEQQLSNN